jgi:signal transduction histidine kinase
MRGGRGTPPWWPEGETWPPGGAGGWHFAPRRFRRRLLLFTLAVLALLVGVGFAVGVSARGSWRGWGGGQPGPGAANAGHAGWGAIGFLWFVVVIGGAATFLAYRRISRPVADLLGAADRLARGDYGVSVEPSGPRELRTLTRTFNDMATRLAATEEQRRRFLADVTHELRTPLAVLQSGIEAQVDGIHPRDDRHLASLLEETQTLGRLIDDLHTLALADAGRLTLHREPASAVALVEDAVAGHRPLAERRGVTVAAVVDGEVPELDVDPTRIRQVLANLLSNAVRHTPAGGMVTVGVASTAGEVRITVSDSGPGFPPDRLDHLFDRAGLPADARGSGLGLSIARDLVEAHGGTIRAGNAPDGGAAVTVTLPLAEPGSPVAI